MIRVAIVGCGKIADQHVQAIHRIPGSEVVAVCDREVLMARQLGERFHIEGRFDDVGEMLHVAAPDVVHITTPPQSHHQLGRQCLEAGSHVYIEKPFTVTAAEARSLIEFAQVRGRSVTAGHNYQFTPEMMAMRRLVEQGFLGGPAVHIESSWSYDLGDASYVAPMLSSPNHWVRRLPGQLFHNIVSHGVARLAEFMTDEMAEVFVTTQQSARLRSLGGAEVKDEMRALLRDTRGTTALFSFSTQIKPGSNQLRVFGPAGSITVDLGSGSVIRHIPKNYKSYLTFLGPPLVSAREHLANFARNARGILSGRMHQDAGMKELIERFHRSIVERQAPPIPYREILLTASIMDALFAEPTHEGSPKVADAAVEASA
jgi:predicted dehydrogenase